METDTVKQREEAVNEECSNAGGHWHPLAGTLACQVVGFTLEPLGFAVKRLSRLEGPYSWLQPGSHCLGHWRGGNAGWMAGKQEEDRGGGGQRESSKWFRGAWPTWRKRWVSRMLLNAEGLEEIHRLACYCTQKHRVVLFLICLIVSSQIRLTSTDNAPKTFTNQACQRHRHSGFIQTHKGLVHTTVLNPIFVYLDCIWIHKIMDFIRCEQHKNPMNSDFSKMDPKYKWRWFRPASNPIFMYATLAWTHPSVISGPVASLQRNKRLTSTIH